jgi:nucleoid-associated protein YgaU
MDLSQLRRHFAQPSPAPSPGRTYVVQPGDNLTKIARRLLGDGSPAGAVRLYEANRDRLSDPDELKVGMELRIPR